MSIRNIERRRKRIILPIVYFFAEVILLWLVLTLAQVNFNMATWNFWAILILTIGIIYSIAKTVNVYQRQKEYEN